MRLSCNFLNVYTIAYRVQYTFTRVHARISNGHPREDPRGENRASGSRWTSRRGSLCVSGSDKRAALNRRHANILATILSKMSVSVPWNSSLIQRLQSRYISYIQWTTYHEQFGVCTSLPFVEIPFCPRWNESISFRAESSSRRFH